MFRAVLVHDEPQISEVILATLRDLGVAVSQVYPWEERERARAAADRSSEVLITPIAVGKGREGRCGS